MPTCHQSTKKTADTAADERPRVQLPAGDGLVLLDDVDIPVKVQEKVPLDGIAEARRWLPVWRQQALHYVADADADGLVRDLQVVLLRNLKMGKR